MAAGDRELARLAGHRADRPGRRLTVAPVDRDGETARGDPRLRIAERGDLATEGSALLTLNETGAGLMLVTAAVVVADSVSPLAVSVTVTVTVSLPTVL